MTKSARRVTGGGYDTPRKGDRPTLENGRHMTMPLADNRKHFRISAVRMSSGGSIFFPTRFEARSFLGDPLGRAAAPVTPPNHLKTEWGAQKVCTKRRKTRA